MLLVVNATTDSLFFFLFRLKKIFCSICDENVVKNFKTFCVFSTKNKQTVHYFDSGHIILLVRQCLLSTNKLNHNCWKRDLLQDAECGMWNKKKTSNLTKWLLSQLIR